jgi:hypothetical protein
MQSNAVTTRSPRRPIRAMYPVISSILRDGTPDLHTRNKIR